MKYSFFLLYLSVAILLQTGCAKQNVFTEPPDYPVIDSLSPASGFIGTQIRLWGSGFSTLTSKDTVRINGVRLRVDSPATSTVLLATLIDSTGTGPVIVSVNSKSGKGPVFTYLGVNPKDAPVITSADYGWEDGTGYSVDVKTVPASDNGIRLLVGGVNVPIQFVTRPGDTWYKADKGNQLLVREDSSVRNHAEGIYANFLVTYNGVPSNIYPYQLTPLVTNLFSRYEAYAFAAGDTFTIQGNFFGDRTIFPSSINMKYNGLPLTEPTILSWNNNEIKAITPVYPQVPVDGFIKMTVKVGSRESDLYYCKYLGFFSGTLSLIAGSDQGTANGYGSAAQFNRPAGIVLNAAGDLYVADEFNHRIRKITNITSAGGNVSTIAGTTAGLADGSTAAAMFNQPAGVALDPNGDVYVADQINNRIRRISGGQVTTFAGNGSSSNLYYPSGIVIDKNSVSYIADYNNHRVTRMLFSQLVGNLSVVAGGTQGFQDGTGAAARFNGPNGVAIGGDGTVYIADRENHAIRKMTAGGVVTTLAGGSSGKADGTGTAAKFEQPVALAVDAQNNVYVADFFNLHIRKITPQGVVTTLRAVLSDGSGIDYFGAANGIAIDAQGALYISDAGTHRIYKMTIL